MTDLTAHAKNFQQNLSLKATNCVVNSGAWENPNKMLMPINANDLE